MIYPPTMLSNGMQHQIVECPKVIIGRIIGRGGETINLMYVHNVWHVVPVLGIGHFSRVVRAFVIAMLNTTASRRASAACK